MANSRPSAMANGYAATTMPRHSSQPGARDEKDVTSSCGRRNMPRNWLEFQASTQGCSSSQLTIDCSGVLAMVSMGLESASSWVAPALS